MNKEKSKLQKFNQVLLKIKILKNPNYLKENY